MIAQILAEIFRALRAIRHIPRIIEEWNSENPVFFEPLFLIIMSSIIVFSIVGYKISKRINKSTN
jgi:hypothetical protein